jgi:hypothetical protein
MDELTVWVILNGYRFPAPGSAVLAAERLGRVRAELPVIGGLGEWDQGSISQFGSVHAFGGIPASEEMLRPRMRQGISDATEWWLARLAEIPRTQGPARPCRGSGLSAGVLNFNTTPDLSRW